jgi:hypothetical protein
MRILSSNTVTDLGNGVQIIASTLWNNACLLNLYWTYLIVVYSFKSISIHLYKNINQGHWRLWWVQKVPKAADIPMDSCDVWTGLVVLK